MTDPMARMPNNPAAGGTLFDSTSRQAGSVAARSIPKRYTQILDLLGQRPRALFEIAEQIGVFDHQISGRITELLAQGLIRKTAETRNKPSTGCPCAVYELAAPTFPPAAESRAAELLDRQGYPAEVAIGDEGKFERNLPEPSDSLPGIPYVRTAATSGVRLHYRVDLVACPGCGRPLQLLEERAAGGAQKLWTCGNPSCMNRGRRWQLMILPIAGKAPVLGLVLKTL